MEEINLREVLDHRIFEVISDAATQLGVETYVIGGYVRDHILKRKEPKDIDIVAVGSGIELARAVADRLPGKPKVQVFKNFGTAMLRHEDWEVEFVGARKESYSEDSRKPVVEDGTLEDDQNRRDFTINALALSLNKDNFGDLLDPFFGLEDLKTQLIRTPLDPDITYSDDPLRMMRAIRFASQLKFKIFPESLEAISRNRDRIKIISFERITEELNKIMLSERPSLGLKLLSRTGLLSYILPELTALKGVDEKDGQRHKENFWHTLEVVDNISRNTDNLWLRYAALFHDIGKAPCKRFDPKTGWTFHGHEFVGGKMIPKIFKRLRLPLNHKMKYVQKMVVLSSRPIILAEEDTTDSAVRRLLFDAGEDIEDLMTLCEADITTKNPQRFERYHNNFRMVREKLAEVEERDKLRDWQPPISGQLIMDTFAMKPCREVGTIKTAIREAILEGDIPNEYEPAFELMIKLGKDLGFEPQKPAQEGNIE